MPMSGSFIGVVGPSGAGKDAVLDYAREHLASDARYEFVQRVITREPSAHERSEFATPSEFAALEAAGGFALSWRAHDLAYGIRAVAIDRVRDGQIVIGNVSRSVLEQLPGEFVRAHTVLITVSEDERRRRIAARGRENEAAARARLERPNPAPDFVFDLEIVNERSIAEAGEELVTFLRGAAAS